MNSFSCFNKLTGSFLHLPRTLSGTRVLTPGHRSPTATDDKSGHGVILEELRSTKKVLFLGMAASRWDIPIPIGTGTSFMAMVPGLYRPILVNCVNQPPSSLSVKLLPCDTVSPLYLSSPIRRYKLFYDRLPGFL